MEQDPRAKGPGQAEDAALAASRPWDRRKESAKDKHKDKANEPVVGRVEDAAKDSVEVKDREKAGNHQKTIHRLHERSIIMPRGDGTGPTGMGPMTGRGAGFCAGFGMPGFANRGAGMGFGRGRGARGGGGRGWRNQYYATGLTGWQRAGMGAQGFRGGVAGANAPTLTKDQEIEMLRQQAELLSEQLGSIKQRLDELST